jgi:hypothetical protein
MRLSTLFAEHDELANFPVSSGCPQYGVEA